MKDKKICNICKRRILEGEAYCNLTEFDRDWKQKSVAEYHVTCFREKFMLKTDQANQMLARVDKIMEKFA